MGGEGEEEVLGANISKSCTDSLHILSSSASGLMSSFQMLIEAFNMLIVDKILSNTCISCRSNKNLPPLICLYFENLNSRQSVWNRDVKTYLYFFSIRRYSIRDAIHRRVMASSLECCFLKSYLYVKDTHVQNKHCF